MKMPSKAGEQVQLFNEFWSKKANFENYWQDVTDLILPMHHNVNTYNSPGTRRGRTRYDSTAAHAAELLAASMSGTLTSPALKWFFLKLRDDELNEDDEIREWLEDCQERMFAAFASSNFYATIDAAYLDLVGYGTTCMVSQSKGPGPDGLFVGFNFGAWPLREYVFMDNDEGIADTLGRKWVMNAEQARRFFADKPGATLSKAVTKALESRDKKAQLKEFTFLRWIYPREGGKSRSRGDMMPIASCDICVDDKEKIWEWGFEEMPAAVARWRKVNDDRGWGRGPGLTALADVQTLNEVKRMGLKALAKDIDPPILIPHKGVIGSVRMNPSGITYYKQNTSPPQPFVTGGNKQYEMLNIEDLRRNIRLQFHTDQLQLQEGPAMTATEVTVRYELMQRLLGPTVGLIERELLDGVIFRCFNIMMREGGFLKPPAQLEGATMPLDIGYIGPLARAQKTQDIASIERTYQMAAGISQAKGGDPAVFDQLDDDEAVRHGAELVGLPAKILRDKEAVKGVREGRAQEQQQALEMQQAQVAADVAQKAGIAGR